MENKNLKAALKYREMGYSVIPVFTGPERKIQPKDFQVIPYRTKLADEKQIRKWWAKWPKANIAIVTGKLSNLTVIDMDSTAGKKAVEEYLPDTLEMPVYTTAKNGYPEYGGTRQQLWFEYTEGIANEVKIITDCDTRNEGGYALAPPSSNKKGMYEWRDGLNPLDVKPPPMPEMLAAILRGANPDRANSSSQYNKVHSNTNVFSLGEGDKTNRDKPRQNETKRDIRFVEGQRDDSLFHVCHCLYKGGMHRDNILKVLYILGANCSPPQPENEVKAKIKSVLERAQRQKGSITAAVRDFVNETWGDISVTNCLETGQSVTFSDRATVRKIFSRLVDEDLLERVPNKYGYYRKIDTECDEISFLDAEVKNVDLWLPFNLHNMVEIMPGNIIVIAGEPNAGKTAALLNIMRSNMDTWETHYFSSEMGASELRKRLQKFDETPLSDWKIKAYERSQDFGAVIRSGEGNLNVIDFLELYDNFYEVSGRLSEIHTKLKGAIAIVALQKKPGQDAGLGGQRGLEKPRLYLSMGHGFLKVVKAKNWSSSENPNGKQVNFKIVDGCNLIQTQGWHVTPRE